MKTTSSSTAAANGLKRYPSDNLTDWFKHIHYNIYKPLKWQLPLLEILRYAEAGRCSRIMISAPPQHGKTVLICNAFVSYYMINNPDDKIIMTAYSEGRATKYGQRIRDIIKEFREDTYLKPLLKQDFQRKTNFMFESPYNGELLAAGAHGAIMGNPANMIIIDDPIKEIKDARSPLLQEELKDWYDTSIDTRLRKRERRNSEDLPPIIIVVAQRLDVRDLQGIILDKEPYIDGKEALKILREGGTIKADTWIYMNFPALSEGKQADLLGREKNTPLWSKHKNYEDLLADKKRRGSQRFNMIMQGHPTLETDYIFQNSWFYSNDSHTDEDLNCLTLYNSDLDIFPKYRFWDLAGTSKAPTRSSDYYCGALLSKDKTNDIFYIHHIERAKKQALQVLNTLKERIVTDGVATRTVIEQEPGSQSVIFLNELQRQFPRYSISYNKPNEAKLYRAYELKRLAENGSLRFVVREGEPLGWVHTVINELLSFDGGDSNGSRGKHDDIVDSLSAGANYFLTQKELLSGIIKC